MGVCANYTDGCWGYSNRWILSLRSRLSYGPSELKVASPSPLLCRTPAGTVTKERERLCIPCFGNAVPGQERGNILVPTV